MNKERVSEIIAALYIFLFVYAGVSKILDYEKFVVQISQSPILTEVSTLVAWSIPAVELVISVMLVFAVTRLTGLYLAVVLMVIFTAYIVLASRFSEHVPCSCGGVLEGLGWNEHLVFNVVFIIMGIVGMSLQHKHQKQLENIDKLKRIDR